MGGTTACRCSLGRNFVEFLLGVAIPLALFIKKGLLGKCTDVSFVCSMPLCVCKNQRVHMHKVFKGIAVRKQILHGVAEEVDETPF